MQDGYEYIEGTVSEVIYTNIDNGYTVCEIEQGDDFTVVVGCLPGVCVGEFIKVRGEYVSNPKYGRQFKADRVEINMPVEENAIFKYLASGAIKGIGPKTAALIVDEFKSETFNIIESEPEKLGKIKGISINKAIAIHESFREQFGIRLVMVFLQKYDISPVMASKIWKKWGNQSVDIIKKNPYRLCEDILSIGFIKADNIARKMGYEKNSENRICAGIEYILIHNSNSNGHTFVPKTKLVEVAKRLLETSDEMIEACIEKLLGEEKIVIENIDGINDECVFVAYMYYYERYIARKISKMAKISHFEKDYSKEIEYLESKNNIIYAQKQKEAISQAMNKNVMVLTGGPGTGKTTVLKGIINLFEKEKMNVLLCAPTGRAAKRMSELTNREAKTVHRMLGMYYKSGELHFEYNEDKKLECDVIICDEVSMFDTGLMYALLCATEDRTKLIFVGDIDQLPSVGAGCVFKDIIESNVVYTIRLDEVFRQAAESKIVTNAHKIIKGVKPCAKDTGGDFFFIEKPEPYSCVQTIVDLYTKRLVNTYNYSPLWDIQIICPSKKGECGTIYLNERIKAVINPPDKTKRELKIKDITFREGDKVMQVKNNYDILWEKDDGEGGAGIFNGDIGFIEEIDHYNQHVIIRFDNKIAMYEYEQMSEVEPAYAITVHKSQGSEFCAVILAINSGAKMLMHRNLLYTAVTRAKNLLVVTGRKQLFDYMIENTKQIARYSALKSFLKEEAL